MPVDVVDDVTPKIKSPLRQNQHGADLTQVVLVESITNVPKARNTWITDTAGIALVNNIFGRDLSSDDDKLVVPLGLRVQKGTRRSHKMTAELG